MTTIMTSDVSSLQQNILGLESKCAEYIVEINRLTSEISALHDELAGLKLSYKKIKDREIEYRTTIEINENIIEKIFDKVLERVH